MDGKDFVKFRVRDLDNGLKSIYLQFYYKGKRHEESLRLYLVPEDTREGKRKNKETWAIAENVKARRQVELNENVFKLKTETPNIYLLEFWKEMIDNTRSPGNHAQWKSAYKRMETYTKGKDIFLKDISIKFVEGYKKYLMDDAKCEACADKRKLKSNSQQSYFSKFKALMKEARKKGYIVDDPCENVTAPKNVESERAYLTFEELQMMIQTPCRVESVKQCFLFSCLTGLRRSDILKLTWGEVFEQDGLTRLIFRQKKTNGLQYLDINEQATELMGDRGKDEDFVFNRLPEADNTNHCIRTWAAAAGVKKYLTFHSGRHTFATLMISLGTDLYTVSKLLGHSNINTTQIYAKILDKNRQEAVKRIPNLNLKS